MEDYEIREEIKTLNITHREEYEIKNNLYDKYLLFNKDGEMLLDTEVFSGWVPQDKKPMFLLQKISDLFPLGLFMTNKPMVKLKVLNN